MLPALLVLGLLLGLVPGAAADGFDASKLEPALQRAVAREPQKRYQVIVQAEPAEDRGGRAANLQALNRLLRDKDADGAPGKVRAQLGIVNGVAAELTGKRIAQLSKHPAVRAISGDHKLRLTEEGTITTTTTDTTTVSSEPLQSMQTVVARAPLAWSNFGTQGQGVTVAVLDSGIEPTAELPNAFFGADTATTDTALDDRGGHGTHVAGIVAGTGALLSGKYKGAAPQVRLVSVKVTTDTGVATYSSVIKGLQWVVANRKAHNIRVANLSLGASPVTTYKDDPLAAAVELTWFSGVVVVASAGNQGSQAGTVTMPGADPYVITVGASYDKGTESLGDDYIPSWTSRGPTAHDGVQKPDLMAIGHRVISVRVPGSYIDQQLGTSRIVDSHYYRLSGTSMAAPVVAGVAALVLSANPALTPDQVKHVLKATARPYSGVDVNTQGAGVIDADAAVRLATSGTVIPRANRGLRPSSVFARSVYSLAKGAPVSWRDAAYAGRDWSTWNWENGTWDNATWDNLRWGEIDWLNAAWTNVTWESLTGWNNGTWDNGTWDNGTWDNGTWDNGTWDSGTWDSGTWDALRDDTAY